MSLESLETRQVFATLNWLGTSSDLWSDGSNWSTGNAPAANDSLVFDMTTAGLARFTSNNDLTGLQLTKITITDASVVNDFSLTGNAITLGTGGLATNQSGNTLFALSNVTLAGNASITSAGNGTLHVGSAIDNGGFRLTLTGAGDTNLEGVISGAGGLTKGNGAGVITVSNTNTYLGTTTVSAGTLLVTADQALGSASSGTTISGGALQFGGNVTYSTLESVTFTGGALSIVSGTVDSFAGDITLGANMTGTTAPAGGLLTLSGTISGLANFSLTKAGAGRLALNGANTYAGATNINAGTIIVSAIGNSSTAGGLGQNDTTINLGAGANAGTLQYVGSGETTTRAINLSGNAGGAVLDASGSGTWTLASNVSTSANAKTLTLTGNGTGVVRATLFDVAQANPLTKSGSGAWTLAGDNSNNFTGLTTVSAGTLQFNKPSGVNAIGGNLTVSGGATVELLANNQIPVGTLTVNGSLLSTGVDAANLIAVSSLNMTGGSIDTGLGTLVLGGTATIGAGNSSIAGKLDLSGVGAQTFSVTGILTVAAPISGVSAGITKSGAGTLILGSSNTYTGSTNINQGIVRVSSIGNSSTPGGLGQSDTTINLGSAGTTGTLQYVGAGETVSRTINLAGAAGGGGIDASGSGLLAINGDVTTAATAKTLTLSGNGVGIIQGTLFDVAQANLLAKSGTGNWTLAGSNSNNFTGLTTVSGGLLQLQKPAGVDAIGGSVTVASGGTLSLLASDQIPAPATVTVNLGGTFDLNNHSDTVGPLVVSGSLINTGGNSASSLAITTLNVTGGSIDTGAGKLLLGGTVAIGAGNSTISGNVDLNGATRVFNGGGLLNISAVLSGNGGITKNGASTLILSNTNSYTGATTLSVGTLVVAADGALGSLASGTTAASGTNLRFDSVNYTTPEALTANNATLRVVSGNSSFAGNITLTGGSTVSSDEPAATFTLTGVITDGNSTFGITKSGNGTVTLAGANSYNGATQINGGALVVDGQVVGNVTVNSGATLGGSGSVGTLTVNSSGTVSPGSSPGVLTVNGNATFNSGSQLFVEINGTTPGAGGYDKLVVTGAVTLDGPTLSGATGFQPSGLATFKIIESTAANPILPVGDKFSNALVSGSTVVLGGQSYTIDYFGGDGNDVVLTAISSTTILSIAATSATSAEGNSGSTPYTFTITRSGLTTGPTSVDFAVTGTGANAIDFEGGVFPSGAISFASGETSKVLTINVNGDTSFEPSEEFAVTISNATGGATIGVSTAIGTIQNDDIAPTLSIGNVSLNEGNSGATNCVFTVTQSAVSGLDTTVVFNTAAGSAFAGSDFTATSGTLTIAAGATSSTITVAVSGDTVLETDETFTVNLSSPANATIATGTATGTIQNDDGGLTLSIGNVTLNEGNSGTTNFVFTATQSAISGLDTTVAFNTAAGSASAGSDFTATSGTLTIVAGATGGTITVAVSGDALLEANETFTVNLSAPANATIAAGTATGTIQNDDIAPTLSIGNVTLNEGNSGTTNFVFTVTQSTVSGLDTTVVFSTTAGSATAGSDFTATSGTLTIAAGATSGTITVAVSGDAVLEANETFTVNLSSPANATIATGTATGTIQNDDGGLTLSIGNVTLNEGNSGTTNFVFTVTQSAISGLDTTVVFGTAAGTAASGSDFTATSGTLTIAAGATTGTITVAVSGDAVLEANETFTLNLSSPTSATIAAGTATGTIQNDDVAPTLSIGNVTLNEGNSSTTNFVFTVTQSATSGLDTTVVFSTAPVSAAAGSDFTATSGTLTIAAGATSGTITVAVSGDTVLETDETFTVNLSSPSNATIASTAAIGTIQNDDIAPTLSIGDVTLNEGNSGTTNFVFTVMQSATSGLDTTVVFSTAAVSATAGSDFAATFGTLTIAAGATSGTITVAVSGDAILEANETFTVNLSSPNIATIASSTATGTIQNDDIAPTLSIGNVTLNEDNSGTANFVFTVTQSTVSGLDTTVVFNTAVGSATAGSDFTATAGTLTIAAGATTGTITVAVTGDAVLETDETFTVNLSTPANATITNGTATGTIQNDDGGLTLSIGNVTLNEGNGGTTNFVFTVTQSAVSGLDTTVVFSTAAGSASAGIDFTSTSGTLTIAAGATSGTITVAISGDVVLETDETFTVNLSTPANATIASGTATGTIQNDDAAPTLSIGNVSLNEGNSGTTNFVFTVTQSTVSGLDTTVVFSTAGGSATVGSDLTATSGTLTIAAGATNGTITVAVSGDAMLETDETFTVNLSSPSNATIFTGSATGTIQNDDAGLTLSIGNVTLYEGNSGTTNFVFAVTQSANSGLDTTVVFSTAAGNASAGSDFTATSGTLTIAAGATSGTITVAVPGDTTFETSETFTVNLSSPNATITGGAATGTIHNDDLAPTLSIGNVALNEGTSGTKNFVFTVTQSAASSLASTVVFCTVAGSASAGSDFTATSGTLTIAAGATCGTITVAVSGDTIFEGNETFAVKLSSSSNATIAAGAATGTIQNDDELEVASYRFDFNAPSSPSQTPVFTPLTGGFVGVQVSDSYNSTRGYGWTSTPGAFDRGAVSGTTISDLLRDAHYFSRTGTTNNGAKTFDVDLPNGSYWVSVTMGDKIAAHDLMQVNAEGGVAELTGLSNAAGQFVQRGFSITVSDGQLNLEFSDLGGVDSSWVLNSLDVRPLAGGDLSISGPSPLAADGTTVSVFSGTGATPGALLSINATLGNVTGSDASTIFAGVQVQADSNGNFSFSVQAPASGGVSTISAAQADGQKQGLLDQTYDISSVRRLDFNGPSGFAAPGFLPVRSTNLYSPSNPDPRGFGWATAASELERTATVYNSLPLRRDGHYGLIASPNTFYVSVKPNTSYGVRVYVGDLASARDLIQVSVEGASAYTINSLAAGVFDTRSVTGISTDGSLAITLSDLGRGVNNNDGWTVSGIDIWEIGSTDPGASSLLQAQDAGGGNQGATVTDKALAPIVAEAIARWEATGLTPAQVATLHATQFQVLDLGTNSRELGNARPGLVQIDDNAAGHGWFIDATPADDDEFATSVAATEKLATAGAAAGGMDLLTLVMHELGHELGLEDLSAASDPHNLMTENISAGVRRVPAESAAPDLLLLPTAPIAAAREQVFANLGTASSPTAAVPSSAVGQMLSASPLAVLRAARAGRAKAASETSGVTQKE